MTWSIQHTAHSHKFLNMTNWWPGGWFSIQGFSNKLFAHEFVLSTFLVHLHDKYIRDRSFIREVVQINGSFLWTKWTILQNKKKYFIVHWVNYYQSWMYEWMLRIMNGWTKVQVYEIQKWTKQPTNVTNEWMLWTTNELKCECTKYENEPNNQWTNKCMK